MSVVPGGHVDVHARHHALHVDTHPDGSSIWPSLTRAAGAERGLSGGRISPHALRSASSAPTPCPTPHTFLPRLPIRYSELYCPQSEIMQVVEANQARKDAIPRAVRVEYDVHDIDYLELRTAGPTELAGAHGG